jgi:hypothetical protein
MNKLTPVVATAAGPDGRVVLLVLTEVTQRTKYFAERLLALV